MASIALRIQLWHLFATDRQKNHSGYFYFIHIQLNGHQHLSRGHTVHSRCPHHFAGTLRDHAGHTARVARLNGAWVPWAEFACAQGREATIWGCWVMSERWQRSLNSHQMMFPAFITSRACQASQACNSQNGQVVAWKGSTPCASAQEKFIALTTNLTEEAKLKSWL